MLIPLDRPSLAHCLLHQPNKYPWSIYGCLQIFHFLISALRVHLLCRCSSICPNKSPFVNKRSLGGESGLPGSIFPSSKQPSREETEGHLVAFMSTIIAAWVCWFTSILSPLHLPFLQNHPGYQSVQIREYWSCNAVSQHWSKCLFVQQTSSPLALVFHCYNSLATKLERFAKQRSKQQEICRNWKSFEDLQPDPQPKKSQDGSHLAKMISNRSDTCLSILHVLVGNINAHVFMLKCGLRLKSKDSWRSGSQ